MKAEGRMMHGEAAAEELVEGSGGSGEDGQQGEEEDAPKHQEGGKRLSKKQEADEIVEAKAPRLE